MSALPLEGVLVVSLEQAVAAPYATRQLADLGARVIKIERPDSGDFARGYDDAVYGEASYFVWLNRSKESLALDLKDDRGRQAVDELLERADVFVQNLGPGAAERLGFGSEALASRLPRLITCTVSGYGQNGPWADRKAYDLLVQCETGLVSLTGDGEVMAKVGISVADIAAGSQACTGILGALYRRATSGIGASIEVSLFDALIEWMGSPMYYTMYGGAEPSRIGVEHATIAPYGLFATASGEAIVVAIQNEREWASFCEHVLDDPGLADDPRFVRNTARVAHREELNALIAGRLSGLERSEAEALLDGANVAHARVNSVRQAIEHPVLAARDRWRQVETARGSIRALAPSVVPADATARMDGVPALGAHTRAILEELGRNRGEIDELVSAGVVRLSGEEPTR